LTENTHPGTSPYNPKVGYIDTLIEGTLLILKTVEETSIPEKELSDVFVYSSPCRVSQGEAQVVFKELSGEVHNKIFNIAGELVCKISH
jgi:hypothetical protein